MISPKDLSIVSTLKTLLSLAIEFYSAKDGIFLRIISLFPNNNLIPS
jgi:hypothetical protein